MAQDPVHNNIFQSPTDRFLKKNLLLFCQFIVNFKIDFTYKNIKK